MYGCSYRKTERKSGMDSETFIEKFKELLDTYESNRSVSKHEYIETLEEVECEIEMRMSGTKAEIRAEES